MAQWPLRPYFQGNSYGSMALKARQKFPPETGIGPWDGSSQIVVILGGAVVKTLRRSNSPYVPSLVFLVWLGPLGGDDS